MKDSYQVFQESVKSFNEKLNNDKSIQIPNWASVIKKMFPYQTREYIEITDKHNIVNILNELSKSEVKTIVFLPSGGNLDFGSAKLSDLNQYMRLSMGSQIHLLKIVKLDCCNIQSNPEWWYFKLHTEPYSVFDNLGEDVLEIQENEFLNYKYWTMGHLGHDENGYEIPLPSTAHTLKRVINGGNYLLFNKFSSYNLNALNDGTHNTLSDRGFLDLINKLSLKP